MRLSNFSILTGSGRVTVANLDPDGGLNKYLIISGVVGSDIKYLQRGGQNRFWGFASPACGDDSDENPYGMTNLFNTASAHSVNKSNELVMSQSLSAPITGSGQASFLFIVERDYRG